MTDLPVQLVSEMLSLASRRHAEAIAAIEARPVDLKNSLRAHEALIDAILLAEDCRDIIGDHSLDPALAMLASQRDLIQQAMTRIETAQAMKASAIADRELVTPWPWLSTAVALIVMLMVVLG